MGDIPEEEAVRLVENICQATNEFLKPDEQLGCEPVKYLRDAKKNIENFIRPIVKYLDNTAIATGATRLGGGICSIIGGGIAIGGIATAPFTLGVSLILTFTGLGIGIGGAAAAGGALVTKLVLEKKKMKQSQEAFVNLRVKLEKFENIMKKYSDAMEAGNAYFNTEHGKLRLKDWIKSGFKIFTMAALPLPKGVAVIVIRLFQLSALQMSAKTVSTEVAIGGRVLVTVGSRLSIALASLGVVLSIGVGIWDCVSGGIDITEGLKSKKEGFNNDDHNTNDDDDDDDDNAGNGSANAKDEDVKDEGDADTVIGIDTNERNQGIQDERKEKEIYIKKQIKSLSGEIKQKAKEMEDHIDMVLKVYLEERAEIEAHIKKIKYVSYLK